MIARIAMFGVALLALWMIWRAVRQWIDANAAQRDDTEDGQREARRISHQRSDASNASIVTSASGQGARRGDDSRDPDAVRDVDAPRGGDHQTGGDTHGDSGSGGSGDSGGSGGGSD